MTDVRLHRDLYAAAAVAAAMATYDRFAALERLDDATHWVVRVTAKSPARELQIARELANFALGMSVRERGAQTA